MNIKWTSGANRNLTQIAEYIARDNRQAALEIVLTILKKVALLSNNPAMGKPGRLFDTRELIIVGTPFIIIYRVKSEQIEILRVLHSSRQWRDSI